MEPVGNALEITKLRYLHQGEQTWSEGCSRVAREISRAELNGGRAVAQEEFHYMMNNMLFIPGGRIMFSAGRAPMSMMNCNVLSIGDSRESIGQLYKDFLCVSGTGGGVGSDWSGLRPLGSPIKGEMGLASGPIPFIDTLDALALTVKSANTRRAAVMTSLGVWHPEIMRFMDMKKQPGRWTNMNVSVQITDEFIDAVKQDKEWTFSFLGREYFMWRVDEEEDGHDTVSHIVHGYSPEFALACVQGYFARNADTKLTLHSKVPVMARDLWSRIAKNAIECGEPGIMNISMMKRYNNVEYCAPIVTTNPCGELPLQSNGSCCLGAMNLRAHVNKSGIQWKRMEKTVKTAVRFLDDVLDVNDYPTKGVEEASLSVRRIGLGIMGLHSMLAFLGVPYGSKDAVVMSEDMSRKIRDWAYEASIELAKEKRAFPAFDANKYLDSEFIKTLPERLKLDIRKSGIRNGSILTIAPTGTTSMVANVSGGIAPVYASAYNRRYYVKGSLTKKSVVSPVAMDMYENGKDPTTLETSTNGRISGEAYLDMQAAWQQNIDGSISQTIMVPVDASTEEWANLLLERVNGVKGVTLYKPGSRGEEPIEALPVNSIDEFMELAGIKEDADDINTILRAEGGCTSGTCVL